MVRVNARACTMVLQSVAEPDGHDSEASSAEHSEDDVLAACHAPARRSIGEADRPHGSSYKP